MTLLLVIITAGFLLSEWLARTRPTLIYLPILAGTCGLTMTTLIAFVLAQVYETEQWMNGPFDSLFPDPLQAVLAAVLWWSTVAGLLLYWQHHRKRREREATRTPTSSLNEKETPHP